MCQADNELGVVEREKEMIWGNRREGDLPLRLKCIVRVCIQRG